MILAGGQGSRLGPLTKQVAKPAVPFGGKYRIIDFTLSNCTNSDIMTVGILTQYLPLELNTYIGSGQPWDMDRNYGGAFVLPPFMRGQTGEWYLGTANAVHQNTSFISQFAPKNLLVLSGDHIYKMDYREMLNFHKKHDADVTIAVFDVPLSDAGRYGIMSASEDGKIFKFSEKPKNPDSTLASMGVYMFKWEVLHKYLDKDEHDKKSQHDFGMNVIPAMLSDGCSLYAYAFDGYWKDVGTIKSLWDANMDMLGSSPTLNLYDDSWRIYSRNTGMPPQFVASSANVENCCIPEGCKVYGNVSRSVLFSGVIVEEGAIVRDSIILPRSVVKKGSVVDHAVIAEDCVIGETAVVGCDNPNLNVEKSRLCSGGITLIGGGVHIGAGIRLGREVCVDADVYLNFDVEVKLNA